MNVSDEMENEVAEHSNQRYWNGRVNNSLLYVSFVDLKVYMMIKSVFGWMLIA